MTNRREFLQIGITATALPLAVGAARAAGASHATAVPLYKVIYDTRFAASRAFAERARASGLTVQAIDGDMTRVWYTDLYHQWRKQPVAIAGLTAHGAMFCFEQLAHDHGLRVVFRAEHRLNAGQGTDHELSGPLQMLQAGTVLQREAAWGACMADVITECPQGRAEISTWNAHSTERLRVEVAGTNSLYTWVIAPAVKV